MLGTVDISNPTMLARLEAFEYTTPNNDLICQGVIQARQSDWLRTGQGMCACGLIPTLNNSHATLRVFAYGLPYYGGFAGHVLPVRVEGEIRCGGSAELAAPIMMPERYPRQHHAELTYKAFRRMNLQWDMP